MSQDDGDRDSPGAGGEDRDPVGLLEFHATLRRHRLSARTSRAIARLGEALRHRTVATGVEWSAMIDIVAGTQVGPIMSGGEDYVDADEQLVALDWRGHYVAIHTHPESTSFSEADARVLLANGPLRTVVAVGLDGGWYVLSKVPGRPTTSLVDLRLAFRRQVRTLLPKYRLLVQSDEMDPVEAWRHQSHEVWQAVAPMLGLRYDRIVVD
jgi:hypothetical protein